MTRRKLLKIDYGGAVLTVAGSVLVILPLNWGGNSFPWVSGPVLGCLVAGAVTFVLFLLWEWKMARIPIVPRMCLFSYPAWGSGTDASPPEAYIFKNSTVAAIFLATLLAGGTVSLSRSSGIASF